MPTDTTEPEPSIATRIPAADHPTGHDLLAVDAWLPGTRPTEYAIELTSGPTYPARYWRCRACGEERTRPDEFESVCPGGPPVEVTTDGGYPTEDDRSGMDRSPELSVEFVTFGPGYAVDTADGERYFVNVETDTCSCDDHRENGADCVHLRRADLAIRAGELPGPDGRYVDERR